MAKHIFVTGGVVSSLGKGLTSASIGMLLEQRGLGLKGESESDRVQRRNQHNQLWGPLGRNLSEDVFFVESVEKATRHGAAPFGLFARKEELRGQDDEIMRAYYRVWSERMGRSAQAPQAPKATVTQGADQLQSA